MNSSERTKNLSTRVDVGQRPVLVDSSVWIRHFRVANIRLRELLECDLVLCHEIVVLELALGSIPARQQTLSDLMRLKLLPIISHSERMKLVEDSNLANCGIGAVDLQLIGSALAAGCALWTHDKTLNRIWDKLSGGSTIY